MDKRILQVAVLALLLTTRAAPGLAQTSPELKNFLSQKIGLSQDQIAAIQHGQPFAKNVQPRSPAEIFVLGVIYVNAAPESYISSRLISIVSASIPNTWPSTNSATPLNSPTSRALDSAAMTLRP
jgi:hypothetical protein